MMWILLFFFSLLLNIALIWYARNVLLKLLFVSENIGDLLDLMENFSEHVEGVYNLETYYGDEVLQGLVQHSKDIVEDIKEYEDIYSLVRESKETQNAEES
tara:strand:- start:79 stop:381 length:303 start_codon:yes stop_codon:yes gene_type:complete